MAPRAVILGCEGRTLGRDERRFMAEADPWGFIVFARNVESRAQLRKLTDDLRASVGRDAPVLIDQEGGRVARLRGPEWREWAPALEECARLPSLALRAHAMRLRSRLIADELTQVGIDVNCAPVLDVLQPRTHAVLRDRCYASVAEEVAAIGRAVAEGLLAGGVLPVMKHAPGQGRAGLDSHAALPVVETGLAELEATDFVPFRELGHLPLAMTAHVVLAAVDPEAPVTLSRRGVSLIRERLGFQGLLMTDDLSMGALSGRYAERVSAAIEAGCDVILHCNGRMTEMAEVVAAVPRLAGASAVRAQRALAARGTQQAADAALLAAEFAALHGRAAGA